MLPVLLRPRHVHWSLKVLVALAVAAASAYLGLVESKVLPHNKAAEGWAVGFMAGVSFVGSALTAILGKILDNAAVKAETVREVLITTMFSASDLTKTDVRGLNAVFLVRRLSLIRRSFYLDPTVRAELGAHEPSSVRWTKGKGIVGRCWEVEQAQFGDLSQVVTAEDAAVSMKLSSADWEKTQGKYGTIVAACTHGPQGISGVVALNAPVEADWKSHEAALKLLMITTAKGVDQALK